MTADHPRRSVALKEEHAGEAYENGECSSKHSMHASTVGHSNTHDMRPSPQKSNTVRARDKGGETKTKEEEENAGNRLTQVVVDEHPAGEQHLHTSSDALHGGDGTTAQEPS